MIALGGRGGHRRRARAGSRRAALHGAPLRRRPGRVRGAAGAQRRRSRAGRPAHRRVPPLSRPAPAGHRRPAAVPVGRQAGGRGALLPPVRGARARRSRRLRGRGHARWPPTSRPGAWTEETLNNLATHYIVTDDDATAGDGVRRLSRAVPAGQVRRPRGVAPRLVEVSRRRLRGRRRDLRSRPRSTSRAPTTVRAGCTGPAAPTPRSTRRPAPTPASSWCAPTISTRTTDASPACTSAPRTRRARRSARSHVGGRRAAARRPAAERDRDPAADPVGRVPARRGRGPLRAAALHASRRRSRRRGPGCSAPAASIVRPSTR